MTTRSEIPKHKSSVNQTSQHVVKQSHDAGCQPANFEYDAYDLLLIAIWDGEGNPNTETLKDEAGDDL